MIYHGPKSQPNQGAKGGVAIILSPEMMESWKRGGSIIRWGGETPGEFTRLVSVDIEIKTVVRAKTKSKFKHLRLTLMTSYHPISRYLDKNTSNFNQQMSTMLNLISKEIILILGADLNAFIRTWQTHSTVNNDANDPSESLFGPHGNLRKNTWGELIIGVLNQNQLRAASTFFESNNKHDTWTYPASKEKYQLDHFLIKWNNLQFVMNVKQKSNGVPSDAALMISLRFPNTKWLLKKHHDRTARKVFKINNKILHNTKQSLQIKNYQVHQLNQLQSNKRHVQSITLRSPIKVWNTHHKIGKRNSWRRSKVPPRLVLPIQKTSNDLHQTLQPHPQTISHPKLWNTSSQVKSTHAHLQKKKEEVNANGKDTLLKSVTRPIQDRPKSCMGYILFKIIKVSLCTMEIQPKKLHQ